MPLPSHSPDDISRPSRGRGRWVGVLVFGGLVLLIFLSGQGGTAGQSAECFHRVNVARDLLRGLSRGRQGLVGSLAIAPLPTVIISLLSVIPYVDPGVLAAGLVGGVSALFLCLYANRLWEREGIAAWVRYPAVASILLMPPVAVSIEASQSMMLFIALVTAGWGFLMYWLRHFELRDLAYAALLLGLSVLVRYQAFFIVVLALTLVVLAVACERHSMALLEGTAITFGMPFLYLVLLWIGGNWLILGNPFFFLRGLAHSIRIGTAKAEAILTTGCEWIPLAAVGLVVLSVPTAGIFSRRKSGGVLRHAAAGIGLLAAIGMLCLGGTPDRVPGADADGRAIAREVRKRFPRPSAIVPAWKLGVHRLSRTAAGIPRLDPRIPTLVAELETAFPNSSFIVTGYEGYQFTQAAGRDPERAWVHAMHLESGKLHAILEDFEGRDIYLLVNAEKTVERWHQLGLEWRGPHSRIPEHFIFTRRLGQWVLFQVIRPEEPLLISRADG